MNAKQRRAIFGLYLRSNDGCANVAQFFRRFAYSRIMHAVLGTWCGMVVGIEEDGTVHS